MSQRPPGEALPRWWWGALLVGAGLRAWLVVGTPGTLDVVVWAGHAQEIVARGLVAYYHGGTYIFNHPPLMGELLSRAWLAAEATGVPFEIWLRAPFALLDLGTGLLLGRIFAATPGAARGQHLAAALYWLFPLAMVLSSHHGNTDSALAFFLCAAVLAAGRGRVALAAGALGVGLWIKFPAVLALPSLALAFPGWRDRARFLALTLAVGSASYGPALWADARVVVDSVFLYPGLQIQTTAGVRVWGTQVFWPDRFAVVPAWRELYVATTSGVLRANTWICVLPIGLVAWARRDLRSPRELGANLAACFAVFYGLTNFWAFQYLAWSLPFWITAGWRFGAPAAAIASAYVLSLYVWLCGDPFLAGTWDWIGHPHWPAWLRLLRDGAILFFFASAWYTIAGAVLREWRAWRPRPRPLAG